MLVAQSIPTYTDDPARPGGLDAADLHRAQRLILIKRHRDAVKVFWSGAFSKPEASVELFSQPS
ncbi:hypothetical protein SUNI508_10741 [Seiridium unicorne]|uniref:Uncharacterized protein n=1 Tax=Seiridium unicorne TaxID=138068 RepID=A0ABR2UKT3_9PEZI